MKENSPPSSFSGLTFAPNNENGVYVLVGQMMEFLPYRLSLDAFELDPPRQKHEHNKYLDAKGRIYRDGVWKFVDIEFKLRSSGLQKDIKNYPSVKFDLLVCWDHDDPSVEPNYAKDVLELRSLFWALDPKTRAKLIWKPDVVVEYSKIPKDFEERLKDFTPHTQVTLRRLILEWPSLDLGTKELRFRYCGDVAFRIFRYTNERVVVLRRFAELLEESKLLSEGKLGKEGLSVVINEASTDQVLELVREIQRAARFRNI